MPHIDRPTHRWMDGMAPTTRSALLRIGHVAEFPPGNVLLEQDAEPTRVMIIERGLVVVSRSGQDEHGIFLAFRGPHELLGEIGVLHGRQRVAEVVSSPREPVRVWWYPAARFREFLDDHADARAAVDHAVLQKFLVHQERRTRYTRGSTVQRVAHVLLDALSDFGSVTAGGMLAIDAPLTQPRIADLVGAGSDAVHRAVKALKAARAVDTTVGRSSATMVVDRATLVRIAAGTEWENSPGEGPRTR